MEVTCPKCNQIQKVSENAKLCSYCYTNFKSSTFTGLLSGIDDKFSDEEIKELLSLSKNKMTLDNFQIIISLIVIFIPLVLISILNQKIFPFTLDDYIPIKSIFLLTFLIMLIIYKHLNKKYDISSYIQDNFNYSRWGRVNKPFEKKIYSWMIFSFLSFIFSFASILILNNISSIILLPKTHDIFIISKNQYKVKGGYQYYLYLTDWRRNTNSTIKIETNKNEWEKYQADKPAKIKTRSGLWSEVIWSLKQ